MKIYVGNLDYRVNDKDLEDLFSEFGGVKSAKVITDKFSGKSKGFGFVEMDNQYEAGKAIKDLNGSTYENRKIVVNEAKPMKKRENNY